MDLARAALQRRTLRVLVLAQVLAGAGLAAGVSVGALLAEDLFDARAAAGLPAALLTLGAALAAGGVGRLSQLRGRRPGLAAGYAAGAVGGIGVVAGAATGSIALFLAALALYGAGTATNLQARYAGRRPRAARGTRAGREHGARGDDARRGRRTESRRRHGRLGRRDRVPTLAGPFLLASAAYALAAVAVLTLLRPDPLLAAREVAVAQVRPSAGARGPGTVDRPLLQLGAAAMILTQLVMVAVMTMTPVHMRDHGHSVGRAGFVISMHVAAMFLPSPITGRLVDRLGRPPLIVAAAVTLLAAGLLAAAAPADSMVLLTAALVLLGLGWNFGLVSGTALLTDAVPVEQRAQVQGTVDVGVALAGATGGIASGFVVASTSYAALSLAGGLLSLAVLPLLARAAR